MHCAAQPSSFFFLSLFLTKGSLASCWHLYSGSVSYEVEIIMDWILNEWVHANHTALLFEICMLTAEGERGSYWLHLNPLQSTCSNLYIENWGYEVWRWEVHQRAEASGFIAIWSAALRFEKFELDLLQLISSWDVCKLMLRHLICARIVQATTVSSAATGILNLPDSVASLCIVMFQWLNSSPFHIWWPMAKMQPYEQIPLMKSISSLVLLYWTVPFFFISVN